MPLKKKKLLTHKEVGLYPTTKHISLIITHPHTHTHTNSHAISFNESLLLIFPCIYSREVVRKSVWEFRFPMVWLHALHIWFIQTSHSQKTLPGSVLTWVQIYHALTPLKNWRFGLFSSIPTYGPLILNEFWRFDTTKQQGVRDKMCGNQQGLIELRDKRILSYSPCPHYSDYNSWTPCLSLTV